MSSSLQDFSLSNIPIPRPKVVSRLFSLLSVLALISHIPLASSLAVTSKKTRRKAKAASTTTKKIISSESTPPASNKEQTKTEEQKKSETPDTTTLLVPQCPDGYIECLGWPLASEGAVAAVTAETLSEQLFADCTKVGGGAVVRRLNGPDKMWYCYKDNTCEKLNHALDPEEHAISCLLPGIPAFLHETTATADSEGVEVYLPKKTLLTEGEKAEADITKKRLKKLLDDNCGKENGGGTGGRGGSGGDAAGEKQSKCLGGVNPTKGLVKGVVNKDFAVAVKMCSEKGGGALTLRGKGEDEWSCWRSGECQVPTKELSAADQVVSCILAGNGTTVGNDTSTNDTNTTGNTTDNSTSGNATANATANATSSISIQCPSETTLCDGHPDATKGLIEIGSKTGTAGLGGAIELCKTKGGKGVAARMAESGPKTWFCFRSGSCDVLNEGRDTEHVSKGCLFSGSGGGSGGTAGAASGTAASESSSPAAEAPKAETAAAESPHAEGPQAESPHAEGPKAEGPKAEGPKAEGPKAEAPAAEAPHAESPKAEAPAAEGPKAEAPAAEAPKKDGGSGGSEARENKEKEKAT